MRKDNNGSEHPGNPDGSAADKRQHPAFPYIKQVMEQALHKYFIDEAMIDHTSMKIIDRLKQVGLL